MNDLKNYTEIKSKMLSKLHSDVEEATHALTKAATDSANRQKVFDAASSRLAKNKGDHMSAHIGRTIYENLVVKLQHAEIKSKHSQKQAEVILRDMTEMLKSAYDSAENTVHAAQITIELTRMITRTKVTHKLLSDLLIADVKNADAAAGEAVIDTLAALDATVIACKGAISLKKYTEGTNSSLEELVKLLKTGETALKFKLDLYFDTLKSRKAILEAQYNKDKRKLSDVNEELTDMTDHLALSQTAYNAVTAAVNSGS